MQTKNGRDKPGRSVCVADARLERISFERINALRSSPLSR